MPTNWLLVRWSGGWSEAGDATSVAAYGRKEGFLSLGAEQSRAEVERIAVRELEYQGKIKQATVVEHFPETILDAPFVAYHEADRIYVPNYAGTGNELLTVQEITVQEDDDGALSFLPKVGDNLIGIDLDDEGTRERLWQNARKMINGTFAGKVRIATPPAR